MKFIGLFGFLIISVLTYTLTMSKISPQTAKVELLLDWYRPGLLWKSRWAKGLADRDLAELRTNGVPTPKGTRLKVPEKVLKIHRWMMDAMIQRAQSKKPIKIDPHAPSVTLSQADDRILTDALESTIDKTNREIYGGKDRAKAQKAVGNAIYWMLQAYHGDTALAQDDRGDYDRIPMIRELDDRMILIWKQRKSSNN